MRRRKSFRHWSLDSPGEASSDVMCPHRKAADIINKVNYGDRSKDGEVTIDDLAAWVRESADDFWDNHCRYNCMGRRFSDAQWKAIVPPHWEVQGSR